MVPRQEHVPQTQFSCALLQVFEDGWVSAEAVDDTLADLLAEDGIGGDTFFFDETFDLLYALLVHERMLQHRSYAHTMSNVFLALSLTWPRAINGIFSLARSWPLLPTSSSSEACSFCSLIL
jgi:hypothetical protein